MPAKKKTAKKKRPARVEEVRSTSSDRLLTPQEAADFLGMTAGQLANWRSEKRVDLPYIKVGGKVRYDRADLDRFIVEHRKKPTMPASSNLARVV